MIAIAFVGEQFIYLFVIPSGPGSGVTEGSGVHYKITGIREKRAIHTRANIENNKQCKNY